MANLYRVVFSKTNKEGDENVLVQATSPLNAIAAVSTQKNYYKQIVSVTEVGSSSIIVGS